MRIARRNTDPAQIERMQEDCCAVLDGEIKTGPVCAPDCANAATRGCSRFCPDIPHMLSDDPAKHPIEPKIAPLVFELKRFAVFRPCWSCEGHTDKDGKLWKLPRVWFHVASVAHVRILADGLSDLYMQKKLCVPWQMVIVTSVALENAEATFSLQPDLSDSAPGIAELHQDIDTIAANLQRIVHTGANGLIRQFAG